MVLLKPKLEQSPAKAPTLKGIKTQALTVVKEPLTLTVDLLAHSTRRTLPPDPPGVPLTSFWSLLKSYLCVRASRPPLHTHFPASLFPFSPSPSLLNTLYHFLSYHVYRLLSVPQGKSIGWTRAGISVLFISVSQPGAQQVLPSINIC